MLRLIITMACTVAFVVFVMMNTHQVTLSFVLGPPVKIRLIFLLMSTFLAGVLVSALVSMIWRFRGQRRVENEELTEEALES